VLISLNAVVQLHLHYAPDPNLKPALLPQCLLPLHRPLPPPPHPHPGTLQDPLVSQHPVLSNHFRCFHLRHRETVRVTFKLFQAFTGAKANSEGVRTQTGADFESTANFQDFRRLLLHISFRTDTLSCFLADEAAAVYSSLSGTVHSRLGRQCRKLWPAD